MAASVTEIELSQPTQPPLASSTSPRSKCWYFAAALILLLAAILRLAWINFELPLVPDADAFKFVGEAKRMVDTGDLRPQDFQYPSGYTNLLALSDWVGHLHSDYAQHLSARSWSAFFDLATIVLTGLVALRLAGPNAALVSMAWLAVSILNVTLSRTAAPDTMLVFWMTAALWRLVQPSLRWPDVLLAGIFVGLAVGAKFTGLYAAAWLPIAIWLAAGKQTAVATRFAYIAAALLLAVAAFCLATPWFFSLASEYIHRLNFELLIQKCGQIGRVQLGYFDYLISSTATPEQPWLPTSLGYEFGPVAAVVLLLAFVAALARRGGWRMFVLALYAALYIFLISGPGRVKFLRFLLPIAPVCAILAGWFCQRYILAPLRSTSVATACLLLVLLVFPASKTISYVANFREPSSLTAWHEWISENIPQGAGIFVSPITDDVLKQMPMKFTLLGDIGRRMYALPAEAGPNPERNPLFSAALLKHLQSKQVEYIMLNSYFEDGLASTPENLRWFPNSVENYARFRTALDQAAQRVVKIDGVGSGRIGPTIEVWRLKTAPTP